MGTVADLHTLDPDSPRTPSQQIANAIRAAILRGIFAADEQLPSQHELAGHYGVARETVKAALRILQSDRLIVSRQGSGVFVRRRQGNPTALADILRTAFDRPHVTIDYAGFNGETLANTLPPSLDELAAGRLTAQSFRLRMLLVDPAVLPGMPQPIDTAGNTPAQSRPLRRVFTRILHESVTRLARTVEKLNTTGIVNNAQIEVRVHGLGPSIKLYLLNGERAFFGFYPVTTAEYALTSTGPGVALHHPSGWDATLFTATDGQSTTTGPETNGPPFTTQAQHWFESLWTTIAHRYEI